MVKFLARYERYKCKRKVLPRVKHTEGKKRICVQLLINGINRDFDLKYNANLNESLCNTCTSSTENENNILYPNVWNKMRNTIKFDEKKVILKEPTKRVDFRIYSFYSKILEA